MKVKKRRETVRFREDQAPRSFRKIKTKSKKGLVIVYTGSGKGKTTAAFGTALRALGHGLRVAMVQFIKGSWKTGEIRAAQHFGNQFEVFTMGEGFTWETKDFKRDRKAAQKAWAKGLELLMDPSRKLVIFDEINYCMAYHFLDLEQVLAALRRKPPMTHVILTGQKAPHQLIAFADLVTEMKNRKHPYEKGIPAQAGIEF